MATAYDNSDKQYALAIELYRGQSDKYVPSGSETTNIERLLNTNWLCCGEYDWAFIRSVSSLRALENRGGTVKECLPEWVWQDSLIQLSPVHPSEHEIDSEDLIPRSSCHAIIAVAMVHVLPSGFSAAADAGITPSGFLANVGQKTDEIFSGVGHSTTFRSLSAPDVIVLSRLESVSGLGDFTASMKRLRALEIADVLTDWDGDGHVCARVDAFPLVNCRKAELFASRKWKEEEEKLGLQVGFRLRVDAGHEKAVAEDLKDRGGVLLPHQSGKPQQAGYFYTWDAYPLRGYFKHLSDLIAYVRNSIIDTPWRRLNIYDARFRMRSREYCDENLEEPHNEGRWSLSSRMAAQLGKMGKIWDRFSKNSANRTLCEEMMQVWLAFRSTYYNQEALGAASDMFPVVNQITRMLDYLRTKQEEGELPGYLMEEHFYQEIRDMIVCLNRALRNRMEQFTDQTVPPYPSTFRQCILKVLPGYTAMAWLCWELFVRDENGRGVEAMPPFANADAFAACVYAGDTGRVVCKEAFEDLRGFVEQNIPSECMQQLDRTDWNSPILAIGVSGPWLLIPEICFAFCLHEIAELTDFPAMHRCKELRKELNKWVAHAIARLLARDITVVQGDKEEQVRFFSGFALYVLGAIQSVSDSDNDSSDELALRKANLHEYSPEETATLLYDVLYNELQIPNSVLASFHTEQWRPAGGAPAVCGVPEITSDLENRDTFATLRDFQSFVTEVVADVGLFLSLFHILSWDSKLDKKDIIANICRVFMGLLLEDGKQEGRYHNRLSGGAFEDTVLSRWETQLVLAGGLGDLDISLEAIITSQAELLSLDPAKFTKHVHALEAAVGNLGDERRFPLAGLPRIYGAGTLEPLLPPPVHDVFSAFRKCWYEPNLANRVQLLWELWSTSVAVFHDEIFEYSPYS